MANTIGAYSKYGYPFPEGGNPQLAVAYLLSWLGPIGEEYDVFDELGKISPIFSNSTIVHIQDVVMLDEMVEHNLNEFSTFKQAILKYGAICTSMYMHDSSDYYFNDNRDAYYVHGGGYPNHAVTVIGWDDNYSRYNFCIFQY